jgi:hypothetical protein
MRPFASRSFRILFLKTLSPAIVDKRTQFFVKRDHGPSAEGAASFPTTRWTIVMRTAQSQAKGGQCALAEIDAFWMPSLRPKGGQAHENGGETGLSELRQ